MPPDIRTGPPGLAGVLPPGHPAGLLAGPPEPEGLAALFASLLARSGPLTAPPSKPPKPQGLKEKEDPLPDKQPTKPTPSALIPSFQALPIPMRPPTPTVREALATRPNTNKNAMDTVPASPTPFQGIRMTRPVSELPLPGAGTILSQAPPVFTGLLIPKLASAAPARPSLAASALIRPVTTPSLSRTTVANTTQPPTLPALPRPVSVGRVSASAPVPETFLVPRALPAPSGAVVTAVASELSAVAPQAFAPPQTFTVSAHPQEAPLTVGNAPLVREPRLIPTPAVEPNTVGPKADTPQTAMTPAVPTAPNTAYTVAPQTVVVLMSSLEQSISPSPKPPGLTANAPQTVAVKDTVPNTEVPLPMPAAGQKPSVMPPAASAPAAVNTPPAVVTPQAAVVAETKQVLRPVDSTPTAQTGGPAPADTLKTKGPDTDTSTRTSARNQDGPTAPGKQQPQTQASELRLQVVGKRTVRSAADAAPETAPALPPSVANAPAAVSLADKPLTHAERAEMVRQVADGVGAMRLPARPGATEQMTLQLHPKDWGRLQVSVQIAAPAKPDPAMPTGRRQTVVAHVVAETPQVKAALENGAGELRQTLRAAGLHLDKLTVTVRAPEASAQSGTATGGGHHFAGGGQTPPERTANAPAGSPNGGSASFASFANHPQGGGRGGDGASAPQQTPEPDEDAPAPAPVPAGKRGQIDMRA